jgi:hypothetical protein
MKNILLALFLAPVLPACAELDLSDDVNLSETEESLTGSGRLSFDIGYGQGYLTPIPDTRDGVADGMVGWIGTQTTLSWYGGTIWTPAFKTSANNTARSGMARLIFSGKVPATGSCTLSAPALIVKGSTFVKGHDGFPWIGGSVDARAEVMVEMRGYLGGSVAFTKDWWPGRDETASETRTKAFDKTYSASSTPAFFAYAGTSFTLYVDVYPSAWSSSEGEASAAINQFGFLATSTPDLVQIQCY